MNERTGMVEALAERLRFLSCHHVQGLRPEAIRPFAQSAGREGWIKVAEIIVSEVAEALAAEAKEGK